MLYAGIDIGSESTDLVIINEKHEIIEEIVKKTGADHAMIAEKVLLEACGNIGCDINDIDMIVGTGYGRKNIQASVKSVTEITCHAKGAFSLFPKCRMVIDIGGQDSKVIKLDDEGNVIDFIMNEKCAAGTGRFLEVMSRVLDIDINLFGEMGLKSKTALSLSSTCAVFAETEIVSLIAEKKPIEDIINGIHESICNKVVAMVERIGMEREVVMTGGVAKNISLIKKLEERLKNAIIVPQKPQLTGAYGAALLAYETRKWWIT